MITLRPAQLLFKNAVFGASAIHLLWAALLAYDPTVRLATAVAGVRILFTATDAAIEVLFLGAVLALMGLKTKYPWNILCLLPQAALLILSDIGVWNAVSSGMFARGFAAPRAQILADQSLIVFISISYFFAVALSGVMHYCKDKVQVL